ncbi:MAG: hypothetical protein WCT11_00360 [Candidatus Magasanikbacteria bacterium]
MTKRNKESFGAPQEAREPKVGGVEKNKKVEVWTDERANEDSEAKANRLFDQMKKDLREKRAEAKKEGKSETEIKAIKFDKSSDAYRAWIDACSDNTYEDLDKRESELHARLEKAQEAGEDVEKSGLYDQWERANRKLGTVSAARRIRKELDIKLTSIEDRIGDLTEKSGSLGGDNLSIGAEVITLGGEIDVVTAQRSVVDTLAVNPDDVIEMPPPFTIENILESENDASALEAIMEEVDPRLATVEGGFFGVEASSGGRGAEKIISVFSKELAKDEKAKIGFREAVFTQKLNQYVGDDEVFAGLLLKNKEFIGAVNDFFNAKVGPFGNKAMEMAATFTYILEIARSIYDTQKTEMSRAKNQDSEVEPRKEGVSFVENETVPSNLMEHTAIKRFFGSLDKKSGIKDPGKLKAEVSSLKSDMNVKKADLEIQQDTLKQCKWYEFNKKSQLKDKIKSTTKDIAGLFEALVHLGDQITGKEVDGHLLAGSDLANLNLVLADQINQLKSGKEKIGSTDFFDRFAEVSAVLAALAVMFSVAMAARSEGKARPQQAEETEMVSVVNEATTETEETEAPVSGSREEVQPKDFDLGITALPGFIENETPSVVKKTTRGARHIESKPGSSADTKLTYEEQMKKFDDQIESQRRYVRGLEEHKGKSTTPTLDIENLGKEDKTSPVWHENTIAKAEAKILELEAAKRAYSLKKHQDDISRETKVPGSVPKVQVEVERQVDYKSLDFSRPYIGQLGTAFDLVREIHELASVAKPRDLKGLVTKLGTAISSSEQFRGQGNHSAGDITAAKNLEKVAKEMRNKINNNQLSGL